MRYCLALCLLLVSSYVCPQEHGRLKPRLMAAREAVMNGSVQESCEANLLAVVDSDAVSDEQRAQIYYMCGELKRTLIELVILHLIL